MKEPASYPGTVWNGLSDNPSRSSLNDDIPPDTRDWDRIVAEVIATQTALDTTAPAVIETGNGAMSWSGFWDINTSYSIGSVVYGRDGLFYVALRGTVGDDPAVSASDWQVISPSSAFVPSASDATGSPHDFYVLANSSGNTWMDLEFAMQSVIADNTDMDNRFESYLLDDAVPNLIYGQPVRVFRTTAALGTGQSDDATLTANTAIETADFNGWLLFVTESPTGNRTNPVSVVDTPNTSVICTVPDTGNTTWNAIVTSWNSVQSDIVVDLVAGDYQAGVTTTGNSTIQINGGVSDEVRVTTINLTANSAKEATVFGLHFADGQTPGDPVLIQTAGTMTFNAEQTVNTFNTNTLDASDLLVPGETYYAAEPLFENEPTSDGYCVPIGTAISPTQFRLRLGLPVKITAPPA